MSINPTNTKWKSLKYRRFLRKKDCKFCGRPLTNEPLSYQGHHHKHSGGVNPSDQLITTLCNQQDNPCHSRLHANEAVFNKDKKMTEELWLAHCIENLSSYVESLNINAQWVCINALQKVAEENEA